MKKSINEIAKFQRLAGLITESEYQETIMKDEAKVEEAKIPVSKDKKIQVLKEWIWYTCDEGQAKDDINKYNKMIDIYFADKDDVTKEDFKKIWAKVTEKYGVGDVGADWDAFPETWNDIQRGRLVNPFMKYEGKEKVEEINSTELKLKGYYQILDAGTNEWNDNYQYMGKVAGGSSAGEVGEHIFAAPDAPGSFTFVSIPDADLDAMVKTSMNEGKEKVEEDNDFRGTDSKFVKRDDGCYRINDKGEESKVHHTYCRKDVNEEKVEEISGGAFRAMDNLVSRNHVLSLLAAAEGIMGDLSAEGFEVEDIRDYINQIIVNDI